MNILENFLFGSNIKDSVNKNTYDKNIYDKKVLINENNALKIQIYLLNNASCDSITKLSSENENIVSYFMIVYSPGITMLLLSLISGSNMHTNKLHLTFIN
jgi:hypothetical protein